MQNELIDISINTMVGNFPGIFNENNSQISSEFDSIRVIENDKPKLTIDVSADSISSKNGNFKNLTVDNVAIDSKTVQNISTINSSISSLTDSLSSLQTTVDSLSGSSTTYGSTGDMLFASKRSGSGAENLSFDVSKLFSGSAKQAVRGITIDDLYAVNLYRTISNIKIPLSVGTIEYSNTFKVILYHDHIGVENGKKFIQRIFVAVKTGTDGDSIINDGNAEIAMIS